MACVFAKGGKHGFGNEEILSRNAATYVYRALRGEGLYEYSDRWNADVGAVSAKSGVGGGIFIIIKGVGGIGIVSPPLDAIGNSVRGIAAGTLLAKRFNAMFKAHARFCSTQKTGSKPGSKLGSKTSHKKTKRKL